MALRLIPPPLALALAFGGLLGAAGGCAPHSLPLYGGQSKSVTIDQSRFWVRWTDSRAEASRVSPDPRPDKRAILARAQRAIEAASGCAVRPGTLYGDWSLIEAYLSCPDRPQGRLQPPLTHGPAPGAPL